MQLCVIAKEPRPGFAKTRLTPPCTMTQAAAIAEASLADTLDAVLTTPARRRVLALDGAVGSWLPPGFEVVHQSDGGLDRRLAAAFAFCNSTMPDEPVVLIGMDTPQVDPATLADAGRATEPRRRRRPRTRHRWWLLADRTTNTHTERVRRCPDERWSHRRSTAFATATAWVLGRVGSGVGRRRYLRRRSTCRVPLPDGPVPTGRCRRHARTRLGHQLNVRSMRCWSRTALIVPRTVPVTFDRPRRAK